MIDDTTRERFWRKVDKTAGPDECWLSNKGKGYGEFIHNGYVVRAHRFAYMAEKGPIAKGLVVRHKCDNPPCCNPSHLELGTHRDNFNDMVERKRGVQRNKAGEGQALTNAEKVAAYRVRKAAKHQRWEAALRTIADGDEPRPVGTYWRDDCKPTKHDRCVHNNWMYEDCGECTAEVARNALKEPQ